MCSRGGRGYTLAAPIFSESPVYFCDGGGAPKGGGVYFDESTKHQEDQIIHLIAAQSIWALAAKFQRPNVVTGEGRAI